MIDKKHIEGDEVVLESHRSVSARASSELVRLSSYEDSLDAYLQKIAQIPLLSREDEMEYARRYRDNNDMQAAQYLVLSNLRFVVYVAKGFRGYGLPMADLVQEGNLGLMKAVERFDPEQSVRLISYAVYWIRCDINEYIIKNMRMVKTITSKNRRKLLFNLTKHLNGVSGLSLKKRQALAEEYGVSMADIEIVETALLNHDSSVEYVNPDGLSAVELLPDHSQSPEGELDTSARQSQHSEVVKKMMGALTERQQEIIRERWLSPNKASLEDLASKYNVSMQRVSQIEKQALVKCKSLGLGEDLLFSEG